MRTSRLVRTVAVAAGVAALVVASAPVSQAVDVPSYPGSLPDTDSAVTEQGRGAFDGFSVKVTQTKDLDTQAVSVSWSWQGHPTFTGYLNPPADITTGWLGNYVQVMQCWGAPVTDPADTVNYVPANPGPAREQCEFGGTAEAGGQNNFYTGTQVSRRTGNATGTPTVYGDETQYPAPVLPTPSPGSPPNPVTSEVPFKAVDGTVIDSQGSGGNWDNEFFGAATTNEVPAAPILGDGTGGTTFQVQNAKKSPALGCGAAVTAGAGTVPCWLVVVPRSNLTLLDGSQTLSTRRPYSPGNYPKAANQIANGVVSSPLASTLWANRIAIPLGFRPVVSPCTSSSSPNSTVGSGLAAGAVLSWQAQLCQDDPSVGYDYVPTPDQKARDDLAGGAPSLRLLSDPLPAADAGYPVTYAPLTVSGVAVGLVFEPGNPLFGDFQPQRAAVRLNQRLLAKLLTGTYKNANVYRLQDRPENDPPAASYAWLANNPESLVRDQEFLALNPDIAAAYPDLADNSTLNRMDGYVQVQTFGADSTRQVWDWILADPTAKAFLDGTADSFGTKVNPYSSTNAAINPTGAAFAPGDQFEVVDPWQGDPSGAISSCVPAADPERFDIGTVDIHPLAADLDTVAKNVSRVDNLTKTATFNCPSVNDPTKGVDASKPIGWLSGYTPPAPGGRRAFGVTDSVSAARYGLVTASLPNAAGAFVAPTAASLTAAASHLTAVDGVAEVRQPDATVKDAAAYPLTMVTYAAVTTDTVSTASCSAYASLLAYAAGAGQRPGTGIGQLPAGYAPLPSALQQQTLAAARTVGACPKQPAAASDETAAAGDDGGFDLGGGDVTTTTGAEDVPADTAAAAAPAAPVTSLAAARGTTKPDPSVFAYAVPIAAGVGLLALLLGPVAGLRRRRPSSAGSG